MPTLLQNKHIIQNHQERNTEIRFITTGSFIQNRLYVTDQTSGIQFLVDSGAGHSLFPRAHMPERVIPQRDERVLQAANNTEIATYGTTTITLNFGSNRVYRWDFAIADVDHLILGADFLKHFGIYVDFKIGRLLKLSHQQNHQEHNSKIRLITAGSFIRNQNQFYVTNQTSRAQFLVDSGAIRSVIPRRLIPEHIIVQCDTRPCLSAANDTEIAIYGTTTIILNFGLNREYHWDFIIADVNQPMLGVDFLKHFRILVDFETGSLLELTHHSLNWSSYFENYYIQYNLSFELIIVVITIILSFVTGFVIFKYDSRS